MDLFVINRHLGDVQEEPDETTKTNEAKLQKTLERALKRKQLKQELKLVKDAKIKKTKETRFENRLQKELNEVYSEDTLNVDEIPIDSNDVEQVKPIEQVPNLSNFTVLGSEKFKKKQRVKEVLPDWLSKPTVISTNLHDLSTKVESIPELSKHLRRKLKMNNIKYLFPVQSEVIPYLLKMNSLRDCISPHDICISAPTGSGKTLTFVLPIIQALENYIVKQIRALVILPTQDLAAQVFSAFQKYAADTNLKVVLVTGVNRLEHEQKLIVEQNFAFGYLVKADIIVCTAGRLVDHMKETPGFNLEHLQFLVIDEADHVLEKIQHDWLYHLERHIYKNESHDVNVLNLSNYRTRRGPQKLLFSATLSQDPEKLHKLGLFQPKLFTSVLEGAKTNEEHVNQFIGKYTTPMELSEKYIISSINLKPLVLYQFIKNENLNRILIFAHNEATVHRLKVLLQVLFGNENKVEQISAKLSKAHRNNLVDRFLNGEVDILISTDSLARGIDLPGVKCVISYDAPKFIETYIHRCGRTARAGEQGLAITLVGTEYLPKFKYMLKRGDKEQIDEIVIDEETLEPLEEQYEAALAELKERVEAEKLKQTKKYAVAKTQ